MLRPAANLNPLPGAGIAHDLAVVGRAKPFKLRLRLLLIRLVAVGERHAAGK